MVVEDKDVPLSKVLRRRICSDCVGDSYLSHQIEQYGKLEECVYCGIEAPSITIEELADEIDGAFERHFVATPTEPSALEYAMLKDGVEWYRRGEPVVFMIADAACISEEVARDVQFLLEDRYSDIESDEIGEETQFSKDSFYEGKPPDDIEYNLNWQYFERVLKNEARFFSSAALETLDTVFADIAQLQTMDDEPVVIEAGPGTAMTKVVRARVFHGSDTLREALKRPDTEIGPPPPYLAPAGRMSPHGIAAFYGATNSSTAIGEVRPPVGSSVVVGKFTLVQSVRLLDVDALRSVLVSGSIFDPGYRARQERAEFLKRLSDRISMPVMPNDEPMEYLVTQVIADYLSNRQGIELDGMVYPSAQGGGEGRNIVLFHKAARVEAIDIPKGTELRAYVVHDTGDSWEEDYVVWEEVPSSEPESNDSESEFPFSECLVDLEMETESDDREITLQLDVGSLTVHRVTAAKYVAEEREVTRHRIKQSSKPEPF